MRSSTSSSEIRFLAAFAITLAVLVGGWEAVLRARSGATLQFAVDRPQLSAEPSKGEHWMLFGNCLVMTGLSARGLNAQLGEDTARSIVNIAGHEQSPLAYFEYLRRSGQYPDVIVANVSSWINGTNFDQEADLILKADPLRVAPVPTASSSAPAPGEQSYRELSGSSGHFQKVAEETLSRGMSDGLRSFGHRYHLFDFTLFAGSLVSSADLDKALYQLNMQSWFRVTGNVTDGRGFVGLRVDYRSDWPAGLERMAERSLQRLRLSRLLTPTYWSRLEADVLHFRSHGTRVVFVRMPEHPSIKAFNDSTYAIAEHLRTIEEHTGAPALDLSALGLAAGIRLFDAVHPDLDAADVITREVASWLKTRTDIVRGMERRAAGSP